MKPSFDSVTLACVANSLQSLVGAQVQRLAVRADLQIILSAYQETMGEKHWLFDVSASWARTHLTRSAPPKKSSNPLPFEQALRKYVLDGTIRRIAQRGFDRILEIDIDGPQGAVQLIGEFTGHRSNLILCSVDEIGERTILFAAKLINHKQNRHREILPGRIYQGPPSQGAIDPRQIFQRQVILKGATRPETSKNTENPLFPLLKGDTGGFSEPDANEVLRKSLRSKIPPAPLYKGEFGGQAIDDKPLPFSAPVESVLPLSLFEALSPPTEKVLSSAWLKSTFEGISPLLEREILSLAQSNVWQGFNAVIQKIGVWQPGIYADSNQQPVLAYPFELHHLKSTFHWQPANSIHEALETVYREVAPAAALAQQKSTFEGILKKSIQHREHALRQVRQGLGESGRAAKNRGYGELLFAHLHAIPAGAETVTLQDFYSNEDVTIALDKDLSPAENAAHYFERAKHGEAGRAVLETRQNQLETELQQDKQLLEKIQNAVSLEELNALKPVSQGESEISSGKNRERQPRFEGHRIKTLQSPDGYEVLVGENATSNDFMVRRVMKPNDWWLHVRGNTSAHAVIQSKGNPQKVPQSTLLFAARQVAGRSAAKHAGYAAVDYTLGKYVRKPRKAAPGAVTYEREKTLHLMKA